ncbi:hypothetical protein DOTSEDRAFT_38631 [Lecanosticta acicola]|uniref:Carboxylesterase type B domain-containing protein n=1 Tax=Lecanosticta acicola TaxID=111012 RepID=A0AAI8YWY0_9PEZI|nr:hypothetical protein DOTSEDRAFT_38631 [Lecanosticta acicola]
MAENAALEKVVIVKADEIPDRDASLSGEDREARNARLAGMEKDLQMKGNDYNVALTVCFISYAGAEPFTNLLLKRITPRVFFTGTVFIWGICMMCMGFVHNYSGLLAARWFLGNTEAGLFPGVYRSELGLRLSVFFANAALAGSFGGLLAAAIANMDGLGSKSGWAWIFIIEGLTTVLVGIVSWWMAFDWPSAQDKLSSEGSEYHKRHVVATLTDWKCWAYCVTEMGSFMPLHAFSLFLPTILSGIGYEGTRAQLLSVPPYALAAAMTIVVGWIADRTRQGAICNTIVVSFGIAGFVILLASQNPHVQYAGTLLALLWLSAAAQNASLPTVDLGYNVQQATTYDTSAKTYWFNNIRYAKAPLGDLRFRAPQAPDVDRSVVQNGSVSRTCPQAYPSWLGTSTSYIPQFLMGKTNFTLPNTTAAAAPPALNPDETEDCLFLDVVVPEAIFEQAGKGYGSPVLVWIYGGGYTGGSKTASGSPAGLIKQSQMGDDPGVIFVAFNYRLGAFGWLSGPTFQDEGGIANAGLYDQRFALEWIQRHISRFGGDPNRVTVFGESAGGGSIMHQITAFGGQPAPFQQAVLQSPGWQPLVSNQQQEQIFQSFLKNASVETLEQARALNTSALQLANAYQIQESLYGGFTYGPAVDGVFAPQLPGQLLARGQFDQSLRLMLGHNANEGLLFSPPFYNNTGDVFAVEIRQLTPTINAWPDVIDYVHNTLYPLSDYPNELERSNTFIAEAIFTCNTFYLDKAFLNQTYAYLFAVPPALHGNDVAYTFYTGGPIGNDTVALALQDYITSFAKWGRPNGDEGVPFFPMYQGNATIQVLNITGIRGMMDPTANQRCDWWQKALYY